MLRAYINQVPYGIERGWSITEKIGNKTSSEISVDVADQPIPVSGDILELKDNDNVLLWGTCGIPRSPKYKTGLEKRLYSITCGNGNSILGRRIVNVAYQNYTVTQIVQRLYENYIAAEGISLGQISDIPITIEVYTGSNYNLQTALNEIAELVGATWQVTPDKAFFFVTVNDFPKFPRMIDAGFMLGTDLQHSTKDYKVRTVQYIAGATDKTTPQTEIFTYDGEQKSFIVSFGLIQEPEIYINNVQVDPALVGINGIDDDNPDMQFYFSYGSTAVTYKGDVLVEGDVVKIIYTGQFPIRVARYNDDKIASIAAHTGTSGLIENVHLATGIKTAADANQLADSLIAQYDEATGEVKLWLLSEHLYKLAEQYGLPLDLSSTNVLTQMTFDLPAWGITGDYVVVERTLEPYGGKLDELARDLKISLVLMNRDYLKTYAQAIAALKRDVSNLIIRGEEVVVQSSQITEPQALSEDIQATGAVPHFCAGAVTHGCLMVMQSLDGALYFPTPYAAYSGTADSGLPYYPTEATGGPMFAPADLNAEVYPI